MYQIWFFLTISETSMHINKVLNPGYIYLYFKVYVYKVIDQYFAGYILPFHSYH